VGLQAFHDESAWPTSVRAAEPPDVGLQAASDLQRLAIFCACR